MTFPKKYSAESAPRSLTALVQRLVPMLIEGTHPALGALREQYRRSRIREVELTGAGFFVEFDVPEDAPLAEPRSFTGGDASITLKGAGAAAAGAGCVLFVREGRLATLEGYTFEGPWPEEPDAVLALENVVPIAPE